MRKESFVVLKEVLKDKRHAHLSLRDLSLSSRDQSFVSALVYTSLQNYLYLNYQFDDLIDDKLPQEVRIILLMGAAQHYKMDSVPNYALVNESVELSKQVGLSHYHGVINAVLKKMIKRGERRLPSDKIKASSIYYSMPEWILGLLSAQYSEEFALGYAKFAQEIKPNDVRINPNKFNVKLADHLHEDEGNLVAKPSLFKSGMLDDAYVLIQDRNSQKVVEFLDPQENDAVLDCCCGPGTKTTQIIDKLSKDGQVTGVELHEKRSQETVKLLNNWSDKDFKIVTSDILDYESETVYDKILIDAPCSGLGVLSHKHDIRYNIQPQDLDELEKLQAQILDHSLSLLKEDGELVYATCTLNKKENERQIESFLGRNPDFELIDEKFLNPLETRGDGFYMAKCKRREV